MNVAAPDPGPPRARHAGFDALRAGATLLVVLHHTAITYGAMGGWYYREKSPDGSLSSLLLVFFCTFNQAWFMGLFFLLAGYHAPAALQARGTWRFLQGRLLRLGLPLLVYGFVIGPATLALAQTARGQAFGDTLLALWRQGRFEMGPLWFAWALLVFTGIALLGHGLGLRGGRPGAQAAVPGAMALLAAALGTGLAAFVLRLQWPVGQTAWGLQLGYFSSYLVLFAFGWCAAAPRWLERWPEAQVRTWRRAAGFALPVLPIVALLGGPLLGLAGRPEGGWSVPALVYALWEPFVAWGVLLALLQHSQRRCMRPGPLGGRLARRAFAVYVIHPPVVVAVALAWRGVDAPALLKFAMTGAVACVLCYGLAGLLLKGPGVHRVL